MALNVEIWNEINATPTLSEETKKSLHVRIIRLIEASQSNPAKEKLGVTMMTEEASQAGDKVATNRNQLPLAGDAKPRSL